MENKPNYFVRTLISILVLALITLVGLSFGLGEPKYVISSGIITVILIVVVLVLSESFNQLSIGQVLNLTKEISKKKEENASIKEENKDLRQNLLQMVTSMQQSQINNTFNGPPEAWAKLLGVVQTSEKKEDVPPEDAPQTEVAAVQEPSRMDEFRQKSRLRRGAEQIALKKFTQELSLPESSIIYGAEFSTAFHGIDPIMDRRLIFDCYLKGLDVERFVEVRIRETVSPNMMDSLYIMLSKINLYRQAKNTNAELTLILVSTDFEDASKSSRYERLLELFQPAISNKLLRIVQVSVTEEEAQLGVKEIERSAL